MIFYYILSFFTFLRLHVFLYSLHMPVSWQFNCQPGEQLNPIFPFSGNHCYVIAFLLGDYWVIIGLLLGDYTVIRITAV